ncbi:MAG TPA: helix-turn-helix domain-containing protein [Thermoleophilaceae bacterium]|nr:helix-turn-helix domain-containing protein [Thermoleophilaceae bacterium]
MPSAGQRAEGAANPAFLDAFSDISEAVESGAGLPEVARAVSRALDASVAVVDSSSNVLAVACASPEDERAVLSGGEVLELRVADAPAGQLRYRKRGEEPPAALLRLVGTLIAQEVERAKAPGRASEAAAAAFLADLLERRVTDRENIVARANELGADLSGGGSVIVVRALPLQPAEGDWRGRVLAIAERGVRAVERGYLAAAIELDSLPLGQDAELVIVLPGSDGQLAARAVRAVHRELEASLAGFAVAVARSRPAADPVDLHRAGAEAFLAANVAAAQGSRALAFEETGAYRLLLPALVEDPDELRRFHEETVAPLLTYDEQYETELVRTLETFLDADGNVAQTAHRLYTHRHTVRYRLERVKELTGLDVASTDGRERLGLGLKAMRVLGILAPHGPATEPGAEAGRVPREEKDR